MYQEQIMDHYKHPRHMGRLDPADAQAHVSNPLCGDELDFFLNFDEHGRVKEVTFEGRGCTVSQAASSMVTEKLVGLTKAEVMKLPTDYTVQLLGVPIVPARLKCATLSLEAVQQAIGHH